MGMSVRLYCNVVLAWLLERVQDTEDRDRLLSELYAPLEGTDSLTRRFFDKLAIAGGGEA